MNEKKDKGVRMCVCELEVAFLDPPISFLSVSSFFICKNGRPHCFSPPIFDPIKN
jgi:hypothetical protein